MHSVGVGWINNIFLLIVPGQYLVVVCDNTVPGQYSTMVRSVYGYSALLPHSFDQRTHFLSMNSDFLSSCVAVEIIAVFNSIDAHK